MLGAELVEVDPVLNVLLDQVEVSGRANGLSHVDQARMSWTAGESVVLGCRQGQRLTDAAAARAVLLLARGGQR